MLIFSVCTELCLTVYLKESQHYQNQVCVLISKWELVLVCHIVSWKEVQDFHVVFCPSVLLEYLHFFCKAVIIFSRLNVFLTATNNEKQLFYITSCNWTSIKPTASLLWSRLSEVFKYMKMVIHMVLRSLSGFLCGFGVNSSMKGKHNQRYILGF